MKLNEKYNSNSFIDFIDIFLPEDFNLKEEDIIINKDRYKEIAKAKILGFCESLDLHVLEMDHTHDKDPRVAIAADAFKILADHWIHRALVIFKNNDSDNYRFSYLTITLDLNDKNKITKKYSNARRYSFYLGTSAKVKTPEQQLIKKGKIKDVDDLLNRFSVEVVNKQFYLEVAKFFDELVSIEDQNLILPGVSEADINTRKSFAVRLIGRTMFCWFLKQKKSDNGQLIPDEILSSEAVSDNYYHNTLEPLFFSVLNTSIDARDIRNELFDKVPYLNGGLFNPQHDDFYERGGGTFVSKYINTLKISDKWFKEFFELLETYNFTIDENTVFDQELSVDPEMLGRIFENLLSEINPETGSSERKRTGSFYTPRTIVEYMVDQSLIEYFKTKTKVHENKISAVVSYDVMDDLEYPLNIDDKIEIISALESLRILDPACGSGAYPIGALQKIVYILQQIDPDCTLWLEKKLHGVPDLYKQKIINEVKQNPFDYTRKLDVIKNSIFGVDIQPIAVDVSRLRCFLTLVVESEIDDKKLNRGIEPLPNLDFKFVCANTLVPLPKVETSGLFDDHSGIEELSAIMSEYFSCSYQRKNEIRLRFTSAQKGILNKSLSAFGKNTGELTIKLSLWQPFENGSNPWFDPEWMFGVDEKFDIVIGNPPYITIGGKQDTQTTYETKKIFSDAYVSYSYKANYYALFSEKALSLTNELGIVSFIIPRSILENSHADKIRKYILDHSEILNLIEFKYKVFDNAETGGNLVFVVQKQSNRTKRLENIIDVAIFNTESDFSEINYASKGQIGFLNAPGYVYSLNSGLGNSIVEKIRNTGVKLKTVCEVKNGVNTGNAAKILLSDVQEVSTHKKILEGKNVYKYSINWKGLWINYDPNLKKTIDLSKLETRQSKIDFALRKLENFTEEKIIIRQTADRPIAALDTDGYITRHSTHLILKKDNEVNLRCVLGILNSKLMEFYYQRTIPEKGKTFAELKIVNLKELPIAAIKDVEVIRLVTEVTKSIQSGGVAAQSRLDEVIFDLYGLNEEEKEIVRNS